MFFNRILNMPITSTTRCRIYNNPTSFMASTYFDENGKPKNSIKVDSITCKISTTYELVIPIVLYYNEEKELFTLIYKALSKFHYLLFNICDLQEVLSMISAKTILKNKILEVKECEYVDCQREDGYFVIDSYGSYFENDIQNKLDTFTNNYIIKGFFKNENSITDIKEFHIQESKYFMKYDNIIIHKSLCSDIKKLIGCTDNIDSIYEYGNTIVHPMDIIKQYKTQPFLYSINSNANLICAMYATKDIISYFICEVKINIQTKDVDEIRYNSTQTIMQLEKKLFTEKALEEILTKTVQKYEEIKTIYNCNLTLQQVIKKICDNDIFTSFCI